MVGVLVQPRTVVLNLGAGGEIYGDVRADIAPSPTTSVICDAESGLPFRDGAFTQVYSKCLFEHLRNPGKFLDEAYRVLQPGGQLVLTTDHAGYWRWHIQIDHARDFTHRTVRDRHFALFTPGHLVNYCEASGFVMETVGFEGFDPHVHLLKDRVMRHIPWLRVFSMPRLRVVANKPVRTKVGSANR